NACLFATVYGIRWYVVELLRSSTNVITAAGKNPLALVALLLILVAWVVITLKVRRNRQLLHSLEKLPEKDRLKALEAAMGYLKIKGGISAEQWLRHNVQQYYFAAFALTCLLAVILAAILWHSRQQVLKSGLSISLHQEATPTQAAPKSNAPEVIKAAFDTAV